MATVFLCFGFQNKSYFLKYLLSFVAITFLYAGASLLIEQFTSYSKVFVANTVTYYDISALELVVLTAVVYLFLRLILLFKNNTKNGDELFSCQITLGEKSVSLVCANDTGNSLVDPYTSSPVLIAKKSSLAPLGEIKTRYPIVFSTINSSGLIEIFYPDKILVGDKVVHIAVGIANSEFSKDFDGLVSPKIIELLEER